MSSLDLEVEVVKLTFNMMGVGHLSGWSKYKIGGRVQFSREYYQQLYGGFGCIILYKLDNREVIEAYMFYRLH